jgi:hypothetical protein
MKSSKGLRLDPRQFQGVICDIGHPGIVGIQSGFSTAVNELHAQKLDIKPS